MDPAKTLGGEELFRTNRCREGYFGVANFLGDGVVVCDTCYLDLGKFAAQAIGEPLGGGPEVEALVGGDENFNRVIGRWGHRVILNYVLACGERRRPTVIDSGSIFCRRLAFIDDLNIVAVRIKHPGRIIARIVFETSLRRFLTLSSSC